MRGKSNGGLTAGELAVMNKLVDAWNAFMELPRQHHDDDADFRNAIHVCQRLLMVRQVRAAHQDYYHPLKAKAYA